ncbi:MAG: hypothetical protein HYT43_01290 [Candidatus Taylorbacteria bacterium]|nr:hypothetical protein [Candidatus Taylorbacteria bacterium]
MSKKTFITLTAVFVVVLAVGLYVYYYVFFARDNAVFESSPPGTFPDTRLDDGVTFDEAEPPPAATVLEEGRLAQKIVGKVTAGMSIASLPAGEALRYVERGRGHVYELPLWGGAERRLTNTLLPKLYEAVFAESGRSFLVRRLESASRDPAIETIYGSIIPAQEGGAEAEVNAKYLPVGVTALAVSPSQTKIFYLTRRDGSRGIVSRPDGSLAAVLFESPLGEWLAAWPAESTIALTTKASAGSAGVLYFLEVKGGSQRRVLGGVSGLTTLVSPGLRYVLWSESRPGGAALKVTRLGDRKVFELDAVTLPEKCAWSKLETRKVYCAVPERLPPADYPDGWYQGLFAFVDKVVEIDVESGLTEVVARVEDMDEPVDAVELMLNKAEDKLIFRNKRDGSVWLVNLENSKNMR